MLFNSIDFAIFLPVVFMIYWFLLNNNLKLQNLFLVAASYFFYGWWDWRFLSLILFSTLVDYTVGRKLRTEEKQVKRKMLLLTSILVNLGFLGFFKYYNFFLDNFVAAFTFLGTDIRASSLNIILPVGISFYTFQTMSYTIDVYRKKLDPTRDFIAFAAFVSFFPQLVAGPIERATNLLPQFYKRRSFDFSKASDGLRQILWGLFKKVVIADNCAEIVNFVYNNPSEMGGSTLFLGAVCFSFQIYGDFSGYSDIAIGTARLFGFNLKRNFAFPYFSRDIAEFWRRWHISLSSWFRDYVYIPLGGSRGGTWMNIRNIFIIFIVSGFWHGASWTFIAWGFINALCFLPLLLTNSNRRNIEIVAKGKVFPTLKETLSILLTFGITTIAWIFFRAETIGEAFVYISNMLSASLFSLPPRGLGVGFHLAPTVLLVAAFTLVEWFSRDAEYAIEKLSIPRPWRWATYSFLIFLIGMYMQTTETPFIYFQF